MSNSARNKVKQKCPKTCDCSWRNYDDFNDYHTQRIAFSSSSYNLDMVIGFVTRFVMYATTPIQHYGRGGVCYLENLDGMHMSNYNIVASMGYVSFNCFDFAIGCCAKGGEIGACSMTYKNYVYGVF